MNCLLHYWINIFRPLECSYSQKRKSQNNTNGPGCLILLRHDRSTNQISERNHVIFLALINMNGIFCTNYQNIIYYYGHGVMELYSTKIIFVHCLILLHYSVSINRLEIKRYLGQIALIHRWGEQTLQSFCLHKFNLINMWTADFVTSTLSLFKSYSANLLWLSTSQFRS